MKNTKIDNVSHTGILVSVVVPVYGIELYIHKCVESILTQSYKKLEVILVDDGSPDACPKICDEYLEKDTRVRVIHKKNGGLSDARNAGLAMATGEYIAFIDGDDWVEDNYVETLLGVTLEEAADIGVCGYYEAYGNGVKIDYLPRSRALSGINAAKDLLTRPDSYKVVTWNKLYKTDLFKGNGIIFPKGKIHEDNYTTYKLFACASKIMYIDTPLYYYIQRADSIMGRTFNEKRLDVLGMFAEAKDFFVKKALYVQDELEAHRLLMTLGLYNDYLKSNKRDKKTGKTIRTELKRLMGSMKNSKVSAKHKILYLLALSSERIYSKVRSLYDKTGR